MDMWFSGTSLVGQGILDVTSFAARPGNVVCMLVGELVTLLLVILPVHLALV